MNSLHRSRQDRVVAGVAGGIAETFGVPSWVVRLLFILAMLPGGVPGTLLYIVLWIALPQRSRTSGERV
jgi:phage shock protein C